MEIRVLEKGLGSYRTPSVRVAQVVFETVEGFRLVHCQFPTEADEREFMESQRANPMVDRIERLQSMGGSGMVTFLEDDSDARIEIFGSVRALAPAFRKIADEFEARLAELPQA